MKILIAADGSRHTRAAAKYVAGHAKLLKRKPEVHLINVHASLPYSSGASRKALASYYQEQCEKALAVAERELDKARLKYRSHWTAGDPAERIAGYAKKQRVDLIVTGSHGHGALARLALGSVATKLIALSTIPVLVIPRR